MESFQSLTASEETARRVTSSKGRSRCLGGERVEFLGADLTVGQQYLGEQPLEAVDAGEEAAVGAVVREGGGERRLRGGAGVRGVREVYHADVDALGGRRRAPAVAGARPLVALLVGLLAAPRLAAGRVRHPAVRRVGAGRVRPQRVRHLALLVPAHRLLRVREGLPRRGHLVRQRRHVEVSGRGCRRGRGRGRGRQLGGAARRVRVVLGGAALLRRYTRHVALVYY